jgi:hypothetical protein
MEIQTAKRKPAIKRNSVDDIIRNVVQKLTKLRERIDITQTINAKHNDLKWIDMHIQDTKAGVILDKVTMKRCNDMWRSYA